MSCNNYWKAKLILEKTKERWLKVNPNLPKSSGIYILTRTDENGIKYAYIGQAKHILERLAQHLTQYQHIDLSLKKHKLFSENNPYGWNVDYFMCLEEEMNDYERKFIKEYADKGYQLRNKTAGGQDTGKSGIAENKPSKGYYDGIKVGRKQMLDEIREYFDKYLDYKINSHKDCLKKDGTYKEIYRKKFHEFMMLMEKDFDEEE